MRRDRVTEVTVAGDAPRDNRGMQPTHHRWQRTVHAVAGTQVAILIGFSFSFPFLPLLIQQIGVTDRAELSLWTGVMVGASGLAMGLVSPVWGLLADRLGRKPMLVRSIAAGSILLAIQAGVTNVWQLATLRILNGVFTGTQIAAAMLIAGIAPRERTGYALGLLNTAVQIGNLAGPIIGGIAVATIGLRESFLAGGVIIAVCTVITIALVEDVPVAPREHGRGARGAISDIVTPFGWTKLRGVLIVGIAVQIVSSGTGALIAIYMQDLARPTWLSLELTIGLSLAVSALAAAIAMPFLGGYADRHDPRMLFAFSLGAIGVALIPQAFAPSAVVFIVMRALVGLGLAGTTSSIAVLTRAAAPEGGEGRAFGTLAAAQNLGWGIGPIVGAAFAAAAGIPALYLAGSLVLLALVPFTLSRASFAGAYEPLDRLRA